MPDAFFHSNEFDPLPVWKNERIVFGILDWGLGHASRSVPIIRHAEKENEVIIASAGRSFSFLKNYFPHLKVIEKPAYNISYSNSLPASLAILFQGKKILSAIRSEHLWLEKFVSENNSSLIVSDNCYGFYHQNIHSIFITHQLMIKMPPGFQFAELFFHRWIKKKIERFNECWVPDFHGKLNLSGDLSHKYDIKNIKFIGPQSRFGSPLKENKKDLDVVYLISGPEPYRSRFLTECLVEAETKKYKAVIVCGTPGENVSQHSNTIAAYAHLEDDELLDVLSRTKEIVCRPGYSTIMDLFYLKKNARFHPTPGQTEQIYLEKHLKFLSRSLNNFGSGDQITAM